MRRKPIPESHGVKGKDLSNRVRLIECPQASVSGNWPTETNRSKLCFLVLAQVVRLQVYNVLVRNCGTTGVQDAPKLLIRINFVERVNPVPSPVWRAG